MRLSPRESVLLLMTGTAVLFAVSGMFIRERIGGWKMLSKEQADLRRGIAHDIKLIESRTRWEERLNGLNAELPQQPKGKNWLSVVRGIADKNSVKLVKVKEGAAEQQGLINELPIECRVWEGDLNGMVRFLFDLQARGAMLDMRQLTAKPKGNNSLQGRFLLYCAYTAAEAEKSGEDEKQAGTAGVKGK